MNIEYTKFMTQLMLRKPSIYIMTIIYWFVAFIMSSIIPYMAKVGPLDIMSNTSMTVYLMIFAAADAAVIAIQLFRTNIDDGTEILIISKPITRGEILVSKFFIFIASIVLIALIAGLVSLFSLVNPLSTTNNGVSIFGGVIVSTLIISLLFGSIAIICSIYIKKLGTILISVGLAFILMIISALVSFTSKTPMAYMKDDSLAISTNTLVGFDNDEIGSFDGAYLTGIVKPGDDVQTTWNNDYHKSIYHTYVNVDVAYQLSSLYGLGKMPEDIPTTIMTMQFMNLPYLLDFGDKGATDFENFTVNNIAAPVNGTYALSNSKNSNMTFPEINKSVNYGATIDELNNLTVNETTYQNINKKINNAVTKNPKITSHEIIQNYLDEMVSELTNNEATNLTDKIFNNILKQYNAILLNIAEHFSEPNIDFDYNNPDEKILFEMLDTTTVKDVITSPYHDAFQIGSDNLNTILTPMFNLNSSKTLATFRTVSLKPAVSTTTIIIVWIIISLLMLSLSVVAYSKRDFA